jgi:glycosyltransferase involved in cell wall biosynthesis
MAMEIQITRRAGYAMKIKTPAELQSACKKSSFGPGFRSNSSSKPDLNHMKLLVFAHVPPPYHGQSYGVQRMLNGFGGDHRKWKRRATAGSANHFGIECYHVNARYSKDIQDIGEFHGGKILLILFYCLQAIWCRFRYGVTNFYYVPAPGKPIALYRDWLVMLICRPFFKKIIFHWHAAGLAKWLETSVQIRTRSFTYRLMKNADLSIVLSEFNRRDAEKLTARRITVVNAGVPDPCPQFAQDILPRRRERIAARKKILAGDTTARADASAEIVNVLYLAHCTREKGLFDTVEGVVLANEKFDTGKSPFHFQLTIIGAFISNAEEKELREMISRRRLQNAVECLGFVSEERKTQAFVTADLFCFPTYFQAENFGAVIVEAMAFGLPIITTRWRSNPEILPVNYNGLVDPKSPQQIADALERLASCDLDESLRELFLRRFTWEKHIAGMAGAIHSIETS